MCYLFRSVHQLVLVMLVYVRLIVNPVDFPSG